MLVVKNVKSINRYDECVTLIMTEYISSSSFLIRKYSHPVYTILHNID